MDADKEMVMRVWLGLILTLALALALVPAQAVSVDDIFNEYRRLAERSITIPDYVTMKFEASTIYFNSTIEVSLTNVKYDDWNMKYYTPLLIGDYILSPVGITGLYNIEKITVLNDTTTLVFTKKSDTLLYAVLKYIYIPGSGVPWELVVEMEIYEYNTTSGLLVNHIELGPVKYYKAEGVKYLTGYLFKIQEYSDYDIYIPANGYTLFFTLSSIYPFITQYGNITVSVLDVYENKKISEFKLWYTDSKVCVENVGCGHIVAFTFNDNTLKLEVVRYYYSPSYLFDKVDQVLGSATTPVIEVTGKWSGVYKSSTGFYWYSGVPGAPKVNIDVGSPPSNWWDLPGWAKYIGSVFNTAYNFFRAVSGLIKQIVSFLGLLLNPQILSLAGLALLTLFVLVLLYNPLMIYDVTLEVVEITRKILEFIYKVVMLLAQAVMQLISIFKP